jgi:hypothetical protein
MLTRDGDAWGFDVAELGAQLRRRRDAAAEARPLRCGHRDPLTCLARRCHEKGSRGNLSDHQLDGWRDTALDLLPLGCMPLVPVEARRGLWRRGGADRVLAELLQTHDPRAA